MVRSGRTSCSGPNIKQLPSTSPVRESITPRPGNLFFIIDYNSLELRTLAAVCQQRIGFSQLRNVLIEGTDPHSYAASMFAGVSLEEFDKLPNKKQLRQQAKVFNFGLPAGSGAAALVDHAKFSYGVELTQDDAESLSICLPIKFIQSWGCTWLKILPRYLLMHWTQTRIRLGPTWSKPYHIGMLRKIVNGNPHKADGTPYKAATVEKVWKQLGQVCKNQQLVPYIRGRDTTSTSPLRKLLNSTARTTTGRLRGTYRSQLRGIHHSRD